MGQIMMREAVMIITLRLTVSAQDELRRLSSQ